MPAPDDPNPWYDPRDPDPVPDPPASPFEEVPAEEPGADEHGAVYEVVPAVTCWRCEYRDAPDRGRCRKCRARLADDDDDPRPRRSRRTADPGEGRLGAVILYFVLFLVVSVVWGVILFHGRDRMAQDDVLRGTAVVEVIDTVLVLMALASVGFKPLPDVSANARMIAWLLGAPVLLVLLGCGHLYMEALRDFLRQNDLQPPAMPLDAFTILLVCVQPAIVEELFFRYVAFGALSRVAGLHTTVWVTAVMFAAAHIYNPLGMPYLFLVGAVLGYARVWGGLALPMVMHFFHNLAVLAMEGA